MNPKILIGTPTYSGKFYCLDEWVKNVKGIKYPNLDILVVDSSKDDNYKKRIENLGLSCIRSPYYEDPIESLCEARRLLFDTAIKKDYSYLLMIEQDIFCPPDIINRLLIHDKDVTGALYLLGQFTNQKLRRKIDWVVSCADLKKEITLPDGNKAMFWLLLSEVENKGIIRVRSCGFGCTLISKKVLIKIKPRIIKGLKRFDDYYFFEDCLKENVGVYIDTNTRVDHFPSLGGGSGWLKL